MAGPSVTTILKDACASNHQMTRSATSDIPSTRKPAKLDKRKLEDVLALSESGLSGLEADVQSTRNFAYGSIKDRSALVKLYLSSSFNALSLKAMFEASTEEVQQGAPLRLFFSIAVNDLVYSFDLPFNLWYLDDCSIVDPVHTLLSDIKNIFSAGSSLGLHLNRDKCDIIAPNQDYAIRILAMLLGAKVVEPASATVILAPMGELACIDASINAAINQFDLCGERLIQLSRHDALFLLRHVLNLQLSDATWQLESLSGDFGGLWTYQANDVAAQPSGPLLAVFRGMGGSKTVTISDSMTVISYKIISICLSRGKLSFIEITIKPADRVVSGCLPRRSIDPHPVRYENGRLSVDNTWMRIACDVTHYKGSTFMFIIDCGSSRFTSWRQLWSQEAHDVVVALKSICLERGFPDELLVDNGRHARRCQMKSLLKIQSGQKGICEANSDQVYDLMASTDSNRYQQ
ncbi:hypothetical protein GJ496_008019 [Pomphorhynchus laevis]|nr:hypothetical protein GJ496_008019 [Pomphorhynchus laevis]